jgi:Zn-dependent membrane protease YugP
MYGYWGSFYWDWTIFLIIPGIIVAIWAQSRVRRAYSMYSKIPVLSGVSGSQMAFRILTEDGISDVHLDISGGALSDNYNPRTRTLNLSENSYSGRSIAAIAVAAHETGHALQHHQGYIPLRIRSAMAPVVSVVSYMLWPVLILGLWLGFTGAIQIAVYIFLAIFAFQMITLPVEYNASRRAMAALEGSGALTEEELYGAKQMLSAAALTYVAATLVALLNVMRFLALSQRRR